MRERRPRISVPFPTPEGPVMTKTRLGLSASEQERDQLGPLALRQAADGLRRRDTAGLQDLVDLHPAVLRDREHHVEDLGGLDPVGRLQEHVLDRGAAGLEVALELRATGADLVRTAEGVHPLHERPFGVAAERVAVVWAAGGIEKHSFIPSGSDQAGTGKFASTST